MSEDRTQEPSKRRRQEARDRGLAAQSPELTAAAGLLGAAVALAFWGDGLTAGLLALVRDPAGNGGSLPAADPALIAGRLRAIGLTLGAPLAACLGASWVFALVAHQAQTRGLWAVGLLAPDVSRLWTPGRGADWPTRVGRGAWSLARAGVVAAAAAWVIRNDWPGLTRLAALDAPDLARASAAAVRHLLLVLAAATLALGAVDALLQHRRFEQMLRVTPEEHREDLRSAEGDPALRARRRRAAQSLRGGEGEILTGATLVLTGPSGLTVVLGGGPPPRPVAPRAALTGASGEKLRRAAARAGVPTLSAPALARRLARRRPASLPLTPDLLAELRRVTETAAPAA